MRMARRCHRNPWHRYVGIAIEVAIDALRTPGYHDTANCLATLLVAGPVSPE